MKIKDTISLNESLLHNTSDTPKLDVELLLCYILKKSKSYLYTWPDKELDQPTIDHLTNLVNQRKQGHPVAYLIEKKWFWDLELSVTKDTLIPRSDTESIIEQILNDYPNYSKDRLKILDLGTGTGAISITLAKLFISSTVTATDICNKALQVATTNAIKSNIHNISFINSNWFTAILQQKSYDIIVSNPPYIANNDIDIDEYVKKHEPDIALFSKNNGYYDLFHIIHNASDYLNPNGRLYLEHGYKQGSMILNEIKNYHYKNINKIYDISGNWRGTSAQSRIY